MAALFCPLWPNDNITHLSLSTKYTTHVTLMPSLHIQILVTYFQILGSFTMFSITWPPIAYKMMAWFQSTFKFEVLQMPGLAFSV